MISPSLTVMLSKFTIAASVFFVVGFAQRSPKTILTTAILLLALWTNYAASESTAFWINLFILLYYGLSLYVPVLIFIYYSKTQSYEKNKKLNHQLRYILPIPWPQGQPDYRQAMKYLDQGEMDAGRKLLQDNASSGFDSARQAELTLHVLDQDYEWLLSDIKASDLKYPIAFECKIIAYGETGQLDKLLDFCLQNVESLASTSFGTRFPLAMIAAYCANRSLWDFSMKLQALPLTPFKKQYWETLLDYNITENESHYRTALESLPSVDKAIERTLLERRQDNPKIIVQSRFSLEEEHNKILELQTRFSKIQSFLPLMHPIKPIASFVLIGFVFILFIVATFFYSSLPEAETQLGALIYPDTLISSESWRFISSCFLPLDWAEFIGVVFFFMFIAFFEGIVGWRRSIPIYLLSGVGSALILFSWLPGIAPFATPFALPGLSTCCMGAFGAMIGLVFQTWIDDKTKALKWLSKGALILYSFQLFNDYLSQPDLLPSHIIAPVLGLALFTAQDLFSAQGRKHWRAKLGFLAGVSLVSALLFIAGFGKLREFWDSPKAMISGAKICKALENEKCTAHWYLEAAQKGNSEAQCEIGLRYSLGIDVKQDKPKGFYWVQKSALQGYTWAEMNLGELYWDGDGTPRNVEKGFYWSEKAAHKNIGFAQKRLGDAYLHGWGTSVDLEKAYYWYGRAWHGPYHEQLKAYQLGSTMRSLAEKLSKKDRQ